VIWSDNSKFQYFGSDGKVYERISVAEEFISDRIQPLTIKHWRGIVRRWGCIT